MKYNTYIDDIYCLIISYFFAIAFTLVLCVILLHVPNIYLIITGLIFLLILIICYFFINRSYVFKKNEFIVKVGFIKKRFNYNDIDKCFITYNNKLSYATSTKRICIKSKDRSIYISPEKMDEVLMILINRRVI